MTRRSRHSPRSSRNLGPAGRTQRSPRTSPKDVSAEINASAPSSIAIAASTASKAPSPECRSKRRSPRSSARSLVDMSGERRTAYERASSAASLRVRRRERTCANSWMTSGVVLAGRRPRRIASKRSRHGSAKGCSSPTAYIRIEVSRTIKDGARGPRPAPASAPSRSARACAELPGSAFRPRALPPRSRGTPDRWPPGRSWPRMFPEPELRPRVGHNAPDREELGGADPTCSYSSMLRPAALAQSGRGSESGRMPALATGTDG